MNVISWNVRGLDSRTRRVLHEHCRSFSPRILCILEPKARFDRIRNAYWKKLKLIPFHQNCRAPRCSNIWILARDPSQLTLVSSSPQFVCVDLASGNGSTRFVFVHGSNSYILRRSLWIDLIGLLTPNTVLMGDFNAMRGAHERLGRTPPTVIASREFCAFLDDSGLSEPPRSGLFYTWSGRRLLPDHVESVLDRILVSDAFSDGWQSVHWATLPRTTSDHSPIVLICSHGPTHSPRQFRFLHMWTSHPDFLSAVQQSWDAPVTVDCPIRRLMGKLTRLKGFLRTWNKEVFGHVDADISRIQSHLSDVQTIIGNEGYTDDLFEQEVELQAQLNIILDRKDTMAQQQSRVTWLSDGDRNTRFYHNMIKQHKSAHYISHMNIDGTITYDQDRIATHILHHFSTLFAAPSGTVPNLDAIDDLIPNLVSNSQRRLIVAPPSPAEIKAAVFALSARSAPGPDGFGGSFYHACWDIIQYDVTHAVQRFCSHHYLPPGLNSSTMILLPKKPAAVSVGDYRPIVLSNFSFKIISKLLASRLAGVANEVVSPHQFGFIKGRNIHDCIALGSEGVNCMNATNKGVNMALKIDISKAFDTMNWDFIFRVLAAFGFPAGFIQLIRLIFSSARLSVLYNGSLMGYFPCMRGVRQGDPLSPIIFGIAEEVLSRLFFASVNSGSLLPMKYTRYRAFPSHLLYADDILVFCKASSDNAAACRRIFRTYGAVSGQVCNSAKSHVYFGKGVSSVLKRRIQRRLGFQIGSAPFDYLGVPLFVGHPRVTHLLASKDKVLAKFSKWHGTQLSIAGRLCLISSVIQSSLTHSMMVYRWPATLLNEIDRACRNFLWSGDPLIKPPCSVSWNTVCQPRASGGLGIRSFAIANECYLSKLAWKVMGDAGFGFELMREKHLLPSLRPKWVQDTSSVWTSIRGIYTKILLDTYCYIGDGTRVLFWLDNWLGYRLCDRMHIPDFMHPYLTQTVSDYLYEGLWNFASDFVDKHPDLVFDILMLPLGDDVDTRFWKPALHGQVTSKLMYSHLSSKHIQVAWGTWIWDNLIPVRRSITCWRLIHERLPTIDLLRRRGFQGPNCCILCGSAEESIDHTFWNCSFSAVVWYSYLSWFGLQDMSFPDFVSFMVYAMGRRYSPPLSRLWKIGILSIVWYIWHTRNQCTWKDGSANAFHILKQVRVAMADVSTRVLGCSSGSWHEYVIFRNLGVQSRTAAPPIYIPVSWWPPIPGWIKVNTDGSALGAPGMIGAGGVFRDELQVVRGCFHINGGTGYAFEAELLAALTAIEIAYLNGWRRLWLETDSTYVVGIFTTRTLKVPWRFCTAWRLILRYMEAIDFRVSHIYREGNTVDDILSHSDVPEGWWPHAIPEIISAVTRDAFVGTSFRRS